jgi:hypothetical protein
MPIISMTRNALTTIVVAGLLCVAAAVHAEQRWQCGDGLSVPLSGSREDREAACRTLREKTRRPPRPLSREDERVLRERIEKLEQQFGIDDQRETR